MSLPGLFHTTPSWASLGIPPNQFLLTVSLPGLLHNGGLLGLICNGEPSWATSRRGLLGLISLMSLLAGYFTAGPSWAYFNVEPSNGLLHSGAFLGLLHL